jgi:hypothetical protein
MSSVLFCFIKLLVKDIYIFLYGLLVVRLDLLAAGVRVDYSLLYIFREKTHPNNTSIYTPILYKGTTTTP